MWCYAHRDFCPRSAFDYRRCSPRTSAARHSYPYPDAMANRPGDADAEPHSDLHADPQADPHAATDPYAYADRPA